MPDLRDPIPGRPLNLTVIGHCRPFSALTGHCRCPPPLPLQEAIRRASSLGGAASLPTSPASRRGTMEADDMTVSEGGHGKRGVVLGGG
jgi:hypothetical protein